MKRIATTLSLMLLLGAGPGEVRAANVSSYPTMLDMTFPEFAANVARTKIMLLPVGSIEEHGAHLPLATDTIESVAQLSEVARFLRRAGFDTVIGPPLNIGITSESGDMKRDGTYMYPGSLTVKADTFVALYVDLMHSLHDNGINRIFVLSGHLGGPHIEAMARAVMQANRTIKGLQAYALIDSERLERVKVTPDPHILPIRKGLNIEMQTKLLGSGIEPAFTTHADGSEVSQMLHFRPDMVRPGFQALPQSPSSKFLEAVRTGDSSKDPSGAGGFPTNKASAEIGKTIADYRTARIGEARLGVLKIKSGNAPN
jgi:creatinine amidohydrolase/Fe(II)-dependent formamide hydrolase-like protein